MNLSQLLESKGNTCGIVGHSYKDIPYHERSMTITSNFSKAFKLEMDDDVNITTIPDLFPEWSRILLSALLVHKKKLIEEKTIIEKIIIALNRACLEIHFLRKDEFPTYLMDAYDDIGDNYKLAKRIAERLLLKRFIPENVMVSKLGQLCNKALWQRTLCKGLFYSIEDRRELYVRDQLSLGYYSEEEEILTRGIYTTKSSQNSKTG